MSSRPDFIARGPEFLRGVSHRAPRIWAAFAFLAASAALSPAWALYKVVGPDGKVTYTDRPPLDAKAESVKAGASSGPSTAGLPYALARVVSRYPVLLITSAKCSACESARQLLTSRGVPFTEKTVNTPEDAQALSRQEGTDQVPLMRIGGQQVLGFSANEWTSYIDAAGFPAQSLLPANYANPAPTPLAPVTSKPEPVRPPKAEHSAPLPSEGPAPAGIRF